MLEIAIAAVVVAFSWFLAPQDTPPEFCKLVCQEQKNDVEKEKS